MASANSPASGWDSFTTLKTSNDPYCLSWSSQGPAGSGKSHLLLTAPEPIWVAVFSDPGGISRLVRQSPEFRKKDIRWKEYAFNPAEHIPEDRPKVAAARLNEFLEDYHTALGNARTVGWDKEDQVWEILRYAKLEYYTDRPSSYYELNLEYAKWFHEAAQAGVNLGVIRGLKEKWGQNHKGTPIGLGEYIPRGQREVNEKVLVVLDHYWDGEEREFKVRIGSVDDPKCRVGNAQELIGKEYPSLDFLTLAFELFPETIETPEVWGL